MCFVCELLTQPRGAVAGPMPSQAQEHICKQKRILLPDAQLTAELNLNSR